MAGRLAGLGLRGQKFIPEPYLRAGLRQRWALLQGLMDSDGHVSRRKNQCVYSTSDPELRDGVLKLLASLGYKATANVAVPAACNNQTRDNYRVLFTGAAGQPLARLPRKLANLTRRRPGTRADYRRIVGCEPCPSVPVRCIQVEAKSALFLVTEHCVPTHNSPNCAANNLYLLCGDGEPGQKVYQAAVNGEQARIAQMHAVQMVRQSPALFDDCKVNNQTLAITHLPSNSTLTILTGDDSRGAKAKEGLNGSVSYDEMHVVNREMEERTSRAGISRKEPLNVSFSTAGDDPSSVGFQRFAYGRQVNAGERADPHFLHVEYGAPDKVSDADIEANLDAYGKLANPAWGDLVKPTEFRADWQRSKGQPREVARFKQYRLNLWVGSTNQWLNTAGWESGKRDYTLADLAGRECWAGLDLSRTRDMTAFVLVFPWPEDGAEVVRLWPLFWLPEQTARERDHLFPFLSWAKDGRLSLTPGGVVDYGKVKADIRAAVRGHDLRLLKLFYDQKYAEELTQQLADGESIGTSSEDGLGCERVAFPQTLMHFTGPAKEFERRVGAGLVQHPGCPVMAWQVGHCECLTDRNNNVRPVKPSPHSGKSVDGVVSAVMGFAEVMAAAAPSVYETRGLQSVYGEDMAYDPGRPDPAADHTEQPAEPDWFDRLFDEE
jgi:phage terminase large subunit-like protein